MLSSASLKNYISRSIIGTTYAVPVPLFKSHFQKVLLIPFQIPIKTYAIQCPSSKLIHKVLLVPSPIPIIAYAIQRPSSNLISKSIIGTIPNANNSLRHPAPHQIICLNQILKRRKESRTIRVWRGEWMKNRTPHTLALKSLDIFWSWSIWSQIRLWCCHFETYYVLIQPENWFQ